MAAVGHLSSAIGDNNPMSLMMKMTNMRPEPPQRHDDVSSTSPDTSLENDDVTNRNHGDEYESDVDVMNDGEMEQKREEAEVKMECDQDDDMSSPMNPHHHRGSSRSESSSRESPVSLHGAPAKHAGTPPVTKATDFSIDKILRSDFGPKSSEKPTTPPTRHQKFDFSMEALAAHCWNSSSTKDKPTGVVLETSFGEHCYTSPLMDYRRTIPSPTLSVSVSPSSTSSPTLSPNGHVHSSPTSSTDHDSSSPSTSPRRHYPAPPGMGASLPTKHPRVVPPAYPTITPYPCNPALLKTLHHQNQQRNNYLQHLITTAQAATHELMTSHSAAAAAAVHYAASPYTAAVVDKLSGAAAAAAAASSAIGLPTTRDLHSHHRSNRHHNNNSNNHSRPDSCTQQPVTSQRSPSHDQRSPITSQKHVPSISVSRGMGSESACSGVSGAGQSAAACRKESEHGASKPALQPTAGRPAGDSTNKPAADGGEMKTQGASAASGAEAAGEKKVLWPAWVYCTRYSDRPSSGPRSRKNKKKKDPKPPGNLQPSNGGAGAVGEEKRPRTAFTNEQLSRLRREFDENRYLTEERRQNLAKDLQLNESQIKIWFQNKRAKIKKSTGTRNALALQLMAQGLYNHATVDSNGEQPQNASSTAAPTSR